MNKIAVLIISLFSFIMLNAQTPPIIYVANDGTGDYNCDGISDQVEINQALNFVATHSDYTTVYLKTAIFEIDEPVLISSNTILTGDETATIKLKDNANWVTYDKPMIAQTGRTGWDPYGNPNESISNVEIYGFKIDGGLFQLEPSGNRYNTLLYFTFPNNIQIHDMYFANGQWDAIRLSSDGTASPINCTVYNNHIYACGHDAISFVGVTNFEAYGNEIYKTRTNSGIRATECNFFDIHNNIIGNSIAKPPSGYAGIQIQNEDFPCSSGEIYNNVIYGKNEGIHLGDETEQSVYPTGTMKNVHIHHNKIYKTNTFITAGNNITLTGGIVVMGYQNTLIEHNIVDGSISDGIIYRGNTGGGLGYQTIVRNNIIINNQGIGINNENTNANTFISNNNLVFNNLSNYNNITSIDDINSNPLFGTTHSTLTHIIHDNHI